MVNPSQSVPGFTIEDWSVQGSDDWGETSSDQAQVSVEEDTDLEELLRKRNERLQNREEKKEINQKKKKKESKKEREEEKKSLETLHVPGFIGFSVDVENEPPPPKLNYKKEQQLLKKYTEMDSMEVEDEKGGGEDWGGETYESVNDAFWKFRKRLERSPEQCLR